MKKHPCDHDECPRTWCYRDRENWDFEHPVEAFTGHKLWIDGAPADAVVTFGVSGGKDGFCRIIDRR